MTTADINRRLNAAPFRPFRIHPSDGTTIPVSTPRPFLLGRTAAVVPTKVQPTAGEYPLVLRHRTVALADVVELSDIDGPETGERPKKRK